MNRIVNEVLNMDHIDDMGKGTTVDDVYDFYCNKLNEIENFLYELNLDWDLYYLKEEAKEIYQVLKIEYKTNSKFYFDEEIGNFYESVITKTENKLKIADKISEDEKSKYERYYDSLYNLFNNIQNVLEKKLIKYESKIIYHTQDEELLCKRYLDVNEVYKNSSDIQLNYDDYDDMLIAA